MDIKEKVAEKINGCGPQVKYTVIDKLADIEINRRIDIITKAVSKQEALEKELNQINGKCDNISYDKDGVKSESMTEKRFNEIKKAKEALDNFVKLLNACLESNKLEDYNKLNGLIGGNKDSGSKESKSE